MPLSMHFVIEGWLGFIFMTVQTHYLLAGSLRVLPCKTMPVTLRVNRWWSRSGSCGVMNAGDLWMYICYQMGWKVHLFQAFKALEKKRLFQGSKNVSIFEPPAGHALCVPGWVLKNQYVCWSNFRASTNCHFLTSSNTRVSVQNVMRNHTGLQALMVHWTFMSCLLNDQSLTHPRPRLCLACITSTHQIVVTPSNLNDTILTLYWIIQMHVTDDHQH